MIVFVSDNYEDKKFLLIFKTKAYFFVLPSRYKAKAVQFRVNGLKVEKVTAEFTRKNFCKGLDSEWKQFFF
jgi:hypothetical protein